LIDHDGLPVMILINFNKIIIYNLILIK